MVLDSLRPSTVTSLLDSAKNKSVTNDVASKSSITAPEKSNLGSKENCETSMKSSECETSIENNADKQRKHSSYKLNESALNSINSMEEIEPLVSYNNFNNLYFIPNRRANNCLK